MKFATKLMVVPFVNRLEDPTERYLNNLDDELSSILKRHDLGNYEKLQMYNQVLSKFMIKKSESKIEVKNHPNDFQIEIKKEPLEIKKELLENKKESLDDVNDFQKKSTKKLSKRDNKNLHQADPPEWDENKFIDIQVTPKINAKNILPSINKQKTRALVKQQQLELTSPYPLANSPNRHSKKYPKKGKGLKNKIITKNIQWLSNLNKYFN